VNISIKKEMGDMPITFLKRWGEIPLAFVTSKPYNNSTLLVARIVNKTDPKGGGG
jgi:hypothetical protein